MLKNVKKILCNNSVIPVKPPGINPEFSTKIFRFNANKNEPIQTKSSRKSKASFE